MVSTKDVVPASRETRGPVSSAIGRYSLANPGAVPEHFAVPHDVAYLQHLTVATVDRRYRKAVRVRSHRVLEGAPFLGVGPRTRFEIQVFAADSGGLIAATVGRAY
jgi:hypothetical protein